MACAPKLVPPSAWVPVIFGGEEAEYESLDEARAIVAKAMELYKNLNSAVFDGTASLPDECAFRDDVLANLEPDAPVSQWSRGFMLGHEWLGDVWEARLSKTADDDEFGATLMTLSFFASRSIADAFHAEIPSDRLLLERAVEILCNAHPTAIAEYASVGRTIQEALAARAAKGPARRTKVPRNALCPCGSGKKYKKCFGATSLDRTTR